MFSHAGDWPCTEEVTAGFVYLRLHGAEPTYASPMASGYVLSAQELQRRGTLADQLQHALDSRIIVEQAKGVLVERHGIQPGEAFQRLRSHARSTKTRVHDLAAKVVDGALDV